MRSNILSFLLITFYFYGCSTEDRESNTQSADVLVVDKEKRIDPVTDDRFVSKDRKIEKIFSYFLDYSLFNNEIYYLSNLPHSIKYNDIALIIIIALSSILVASIIPLFRIYKITPNLVLR